MYGLTSADSILIISWFLAQRQLSTTMVDLVWTVAGTLCSWNRYAWIRRFDEAATLQFRPSYALIFLFRL
jgi:hypothetical protein